MSNNKKAKSEENILTTSATSADLEGVNLPAKDEEAEAKAAKEAEEAAKAAKLDEAVKAFVSYEAKKASEERAKAAKEVAKEAYLKQFAGNAKALLVARKVEKIDTRLKFHDFKYSFVDENNMTVPEEGRVNVTEVFTPKAAKAFREAVSNIARQVVPFHDAEGDEARAAVREKVAEDFKLVFEYLGVTCEGDWKKARRKDMNAILSSAFGTDYSGDDDAKKKLIIEAAWPRARRILLGREAAKNAYEAKEAEAKAKKESAKTEAA